MKTIAAVLLFAASMLIAQTPCINCPGSGGGGGSAPTSNEINTNPVAGTSFTFSVTNQTRLWWFNLSETLLAATQLEYQVATADNTANHYDVGVYNASGTLICDIGATVGTTFAPSTGNKILPFLTTCPNMTEGARYYIAATTDCSASCAAIYSYQPGATGVFSPVSGGVPTSGNVTTGGALNPSVGIPADNWTPYAAPNLALHH